MAYMQGHLSDAAYHSSERTWNFAGGRAQAAAAGQIWHERERPHHAGHPGSHTDGPGPHGL